jgi:L-threonylcarbamoyladenylate synthase
MNTSFKPSLLERRLVTPEEGARLLKQGGLVILPTETVYGLGVDATQSDALARMYFLKNRPVTHPVILHLASVDQLSEWAKDIPDVAYQLAEAFWPGPMTLILKRSERVKDQITGGQDTVGIRIPSHPLALKLLEAFGGAVAAPSANRFGKLSPTQIHHLDPLLLEDVDGVVDGGPCEVGIESTIIDCSGIDCSGIDCSGIDYSGIDYSGIDYSGIDYSGIDYSGIGHPPRILRPGMISMAQIQAALNLSPNWENTKSGSSESRSPDKPVPVVSGSLASHYAPNTSVKLLFQAEADLRDSKNIGLLRLASSTLSPDFLEAIAHQIMLPNEPEGYAQRLYEALHILDQKQLDVIYIELPDVTDSSWQGILDRLHRAASPIG